MSKLSLSYDILNNTPANASPVEANFNRIEQHINQEVIERGGTVGMAAQLKLVGDPVAPLDAATKQYVDAILPISIIMMYAGSALPPGGRWAFCNGAELETAAYQDLFNAIGTAYGSGSAGRFNLPNLNDRMPMGAGGSYVRGATGGSKDAVVVSHTHPIDHKHPNTRSGTATANHTHDYSGNTLNESTTHYHEPLSGYSGFIGQRTAGGGTGAVGAGTAVAVTANTAVNNTGHTHPFSGVTTAESNQHDHFTDIPQYTGASGAAANGVAGTDKNLPPYVGVLYIIRIA